jgi:tryptophanyl-tRNA synthetase
VPGLDGRKMSKSYDNTIPLFEGGAKDLQEAIARIVTDSRLPGEPKDPDSTSLTALFDAFATPAEREAFRAELRSGLGWGEAKQRLLKQIEREIAPLRERYEALIADPAKIEAILQEGARKARALATPLLAELRQAVGLRPMLAPPVTAQQAKEKSAAQHALFKQYRESDGRFYFKLTDAQGRILLQSTGFEQGREAGQWVGRLKQEGLAALTAEAPASLADGITREELAAALASFNED